MVQVPTKLETYSNIFMSLKTLPTVKGEFGRTLLAHIHEILGEREKRNMFNGFKSLGQPLYGKLEG